MSSKSVKSSRRRTRSNSPLQQTRILRSISLSSCCCRYGYVPLFLAILISLSCLLDVYSSISCEFLQVFVQTDDGSTRGSAFVGIFFRQTGALDAELFGQSYLAEGCQPYSQEFEDNVVNNDKVWLTSRYIAMISAASGGAAAVVCWLFCFTPISITCLWRGLLLPLLIIAFLAEFLKFLFLDVNLCNAPLWNTNRTNCQLGTSSYFGMAASAIFFLCPILVCCFQPQEKQILELDNDKMDQVRVSPSGETQQEQMESQSAQSSLRPQSSETTEASNSSRMDPIGESRSERRITFVSTQSSPRLPIDP